MAAIKKVQFYADKTNCYQNRLFSFQVDCLTSAFRILLRFHCHGNKFRSIYLKNTQTNRILDDETLIRLYDYESFFKDYDVSHFPTLQEAYNDFCIFIA